MKWLCWFLLLLNTSFAWSASLPKDVQRFVERRDGCDHFRGEDAYDEERGRFINQNLKKLCTGTDRQLLKLRKKYVDQPSIMKKLDDYELDIEMSEQK